jgi:hypothetical protein
MSGIRQQFTYANVVATLALAIALGMGTAWAAAKLGKNSVGTKQLKHDAVISKKVKDGSLLGVDFAAGQLPKGATGAQGPQGEQGIQGIQGIQGPAGPTFAAQKDVDDPVAGQEGTFFGQPFTLPSAGRVLAMLDSPDLSASCSAGNPYIGLYIDGNAVPNTKRTITSGTTKAVSLFGLTGPLTAGVHGIAIGVVCPGGANTITGGSTSTTETSMGVVLIGN